MGHVGQNPAWHPPRPAHKTRLEKVLAHKLSERMALIRRLSIVLNSLTERTALVPSAVATGKVVSSSVESESRNRLLGRVTFVAPPRTPAVAEAGFPKPTDLVRREQVEAGTETLSSWREQALERRDHCGAQSEQFGGPRWARGPSLLIALGIVRSGGIGGPNPSVLDLST